MTDNSFKPTQNNETLIEVKYNTLSVKKQPLRVIGYRAKLPAYLKEHEGGEWEEISLYIGVNRAGPRQDLSDREPMNWVKKLMYILKDDKKYEPETPGKILYVPHIKALTLKIESPIASSVETLIMKGGVQKLTVDRENVATGRINAGPLRNVWFYGELNLLEFTNIPSGTFRVPYTTKHISTDNQSNIIGLHKLVEHEPDINVDMQFDGELIRGTIGAMMPF